MAFWNKKDQDVKIEHVRVELRVSYEYAKRLKDLCADHGYSCEVLCSDSCTETLRIYLPKRQVDKVLDMASSVVTKFI